MAASIKDVAERAGVSVGTVSNVLNRPQKVSPETARKVHDAINSLGFIRNDAARQLREGRSRSIGLIVLDVANPFFTDLARGAEDRAAEHDLTVLLGNSDKSDTREAAYLEHFLEQRVQGVLLSPRGEISDRIDLMHDRGTAVVLVDRDGTGHGVSSVSVDDVVGGYLAVNHLAEIGRKRIAFVGGPSSFRQVSDRFAGAHNAAVEHPGISLEKIETESLTVSAGRSAGDAISARLPDARPDAIFAANDLLAIGLVQSFVKLGDVRVPEDIAIVGYDDIAFAEAAIVPLSSIRQPSELIGATAVDLLLKDAAHDPKFIPQHVVFQPELVVRDSSVPRSEGE